MYTYLNICTSVFTCPTHVCGATTGWQSNSLIAMMYPVENSNIAYLDIYDKLQIELLNHYYIRLPAIEFQTQDEHKQTTYWSETPYWEG